MIEFQATENDSDGTADRPPESLLDLMLRATPEGLDVEFDEVDSLRERRVRTLDLATLDERLGNALVERLEELECRRDELARIPLGTGSPEGAERRRWLGEHCRDLERDIARELLEVRLRLRPDDERSASPSAAGPSAS